MAVLNIGGMDVDGEQQSIGVGNDMPLAPVNTFAGIVASRTASLGRWGALTVNDRCRWSGLASKLPAGLPRPAQMTSMASAGQSAPTPHPSYRLRTAAHYVDIAHE